MERQAASWATSFGLMDSGQVPAASSNRDLAEDKNAGPSTPSKRWRWPYPHSAG